MLIRWIPGERKKRYGFGGQAGVYPNEVTMGTEFHPFAEGHSEKSERSD
jgi:hypothetical protein